VAPGLAGLTFNWGTLMGSCGGDKCLEHVASIRALTPRLAALRRTRLHRLSTLVIAGGQTTTPNIAHQQLLDNSATRHYLRASGYRGRGLWLGRPGGWG
jgi:hypothetical protein